MAGNVMTYTLEGTRSIPIANISTSERFCEPTQKQIDDMAASLKMVGQLTAIMVHPAERNGWRIVAGGTRLRAAFKLGWTKIRADIIAGPSIDYKIIELTENVSRRNLTATQRKETRAELRRLLAQKLATVKASKGGRGHKGGMREAARQMGVSKDTAHRAMKLSQNSKSETVSEPKPNGQGGSHEPPRAALAASSAPVQRATPVALGQAKFPIAVKTTRDERDRVERYNKERCGNGPLSDCGRRLFRIALHSEGF